MDRRDGRVFFSVSFQYQSSGGEIKKNRTPVSCISPQEYVVQNYFAVTASGSTITASTAALLASHVDLARTREVISVLNALILKRKGSLNRSGENKSRRFRFTHIVARRALAVVGK
jgi:hypothetical protein